MFDDNAQTIVQCQAGRPLFSARAKPRATALLMPKEGSNAFPYLEYAIIWDENAVSQYLKHEVTLPFMPCLTR
jgi:hypothetical protein